MEFVKVKICGVETEVPKTYYEWVIALGNSFSNADFLREKLRKEIEDYDRERIQSKN